MDTTQIKKNGFTLKSKYCLKIIAVALFVTGFVLFSGCRKEDLKQKQNTILQHVTIQNAVHNGITFSHDSGVYETANLKVHIKAPEGYTIAFTTNGTKPSGKDARGKSELDVTLNRSMSGYLMDHKQKMFCPALPGSVLFQDDGLPAGIVLNTALVDGKGVVCDNVQTNVYFLQTDFAKRFSNCLIVSVAADPDNFLDYHTGILASGATFDKWKETDNGKRLLAEKKQWKFETNSTQRGMEWERPCQVQIYKNIATEPDVITDAGIRVRGGMSSRLNQKSFRFYFREKYGSDLLQYALFNKKEEYNSFSLRNGGNDTEYLKFKDAFIQDLGKGGKFTVFHTRPAVLFLNGEYWGPYTLIEVLSGKMLHARFGVDEKNVVAIKEAKVRVGKQEDIKLYEKLQTFSDKDLTDPEAYRQFCDVMDVQSMADYFAMRIYIGDGDWFPNHNHVLWRTRDKSYNGGRWQYIVHDTEYSAGHYNQRLTSPETDHFRRAMEYFPLFRAAIRNKEFYALFLEAIKKVGSENYKYSRVLEKMNSYDKTWGPLMPDFYKRFGDSSRNREKCMELTLNFFKKRYDIIIPIVEKWRP